MDAECIDPSSATELLVFGWRNASSKEHLGKEKP
jgi:hypothetical protein